MGLTVTIIDDEARMGELIQRALDRQGHRARAWTRADEALEHARTEGPPDVVLTDLKMSGLSGLDVLEQVRRTFPNTVVVLMTAYASAQSAVEALRKGAYDYLIKPFPMDELLVLLDRVAERAELRAENERLRSTLGEAGRFEHVVGVSAPMRDVLEKVRRVAPTDACVLLRGESGTGKEVVATAIHAASRRARGPLVRINCGAIPENLMESELFGHTKGSFTGADRDKPGYFHAADGGTLFLDEIGELPPALQVKLLRALQDGCITSVGGREPVQVDVRIIAATNRDLEAALEEGTFRQDLYYRLNVVPLSLPPLRERGDDILPLVDFFLSRLAGKGRSIRPFDNEALDVMRRYPWPGNIRELQNAVEHASVMATEEKVTVDDLPAGLREFAGKPVRSGSDAAAFDGLTLEAAERLLILRALEAENWNQTHTARRLGTTRRTLGYRMARHGIPSRPGGPIPAMPTGERGDDASSETDAHALGEQVGSEAP